MPSHCGSGPAGVICQIKSIPSNAADSVGSAIGSATGSVLHEIAAAMASAADGLLKTLSTFWMRVDTPQLSGAGSPVAVIQADTKWIVAMTAVVCVLVAAGKMALRRRGEPAAVMAMGLARLVVVSAAATFVVELAGQAGDMFSADLMNSAQLGSHGWAGIISVAGISAAFAPGDGMLLIVALFIIFSALIQLLLMVLRVGLLIILTGTLPLAAAASMSDWGETWWRKHLGWLAAWLLYKPAAALLFASASALTHGKRSLLEILAGFMLLTLSVLILPALLRVIVPMTAALGAASGGGLAIGGAGAVATGAVRLGGASGIRSALAGRASRDPSPAARETPAGAEDGAQGDAPSGSHPGSSERAGADSPDSAGSSPGANAADSTDETDSAGTDQAPASQPENPSPPPDTNGHGPETAASRPGSTAEADTSRNDTVLSATRPAGERLDQDHNADGPSGAVDADDAPTENGG